VSGRPPSSRQYPRWSNRRIQLILEQSLSHPYCHGHLSDYSQIIHFHSSTIQYQTSSWILSISSHLDHSSSNSCPSTHRMQHAICQSVRPCLCPWLDTARHKTVMEKVVELHMPDQVYNWIVDLSAITRTVHGTPTWTRRSQLWRLAVGGLV